MDDSHYAQSDLRFLVPLRRGQRAVVFGEAPALVEGLQEEGLAVARGDWRLEDRDSAFDHAFVIELGGVEVEQCIRAAVKGVGPGGWLAIGFRNAEGVHRFAGGRLPEEKRSPTRSLRAMRRMLAQHGLEIVACYGAHSDLARPQFLVPLDTPAGACHFYETMWVPYSRAGALMRRSAPLLAALGLQRLLFRDIVVVAQRR